MEQEPDVELQQLALTISQTAQMLAISRSLMYKLLRKGAGPTTVRFESNIRIRVAALQEWIEQREKDQLRD